MINKLKIGLICDEKTTNIPSKINKKYNIFFPDNSYYIPLALPQCWIDEINEKPESNNVTDDEYNPLENKKFYSTVIRDRDAKIIKFTPIKTTNISKITQSISLFNVGKKYESPSKILKNKKNKYKKYMDQIDLIHKKLFTPKPYKKTFNLTHGSFQTISSNSIMINNYSSANSNSSNPSSHNIRIQRINSSSSEFSSYINPLNDNFLLSKFQKGSLSNKNKAPKKDLFYIINNHI